MTVHATDYESRLGCAKQQMYQLCEKAEAALKRPPPADSHFPKKLSYTERMTCFNDFFSTQEWMLKSGVHNTIFRANRHRGRPIDVETEGVRIKLRYRADNDGNPARFFHVVSINIFPKSHLKTLMCVGPKVGSELRKKREEDKRAWFQDQFIGTLNILFEAEEISVVHHEFLYRPLDNEKEYLASMGNDWLQVLRGAVDRGFVWEPSAAHGAEADLLFGQMQRTGKMWRWQQLSDVPEEAARANRMVRFGLIRMKFSADL